MDRLLRAAAAEDPIEVMLVQQLVLSHFRIAQLQCQAGEAKGLEAVKLYSAAAARLLAEFRRLALAVRLYRMPVPKTAAARAAAKKLKIAGAA